MKYDKYCIIFDTNILFVTYKNYADFNNFKFNSTFDNTIRLIESNDLVSNIDICIPNVVWNEIKKHNLEAYKEKNDKITNTIEKIKVPNISFKMKEIDYEIFLNDKIKKYKEELSKLIPKVDELQLPKNDCFEQIIDRAYNKRPPFCGEEKTSDKGFKDALLWESIIQYRKVNNVGILFYTKDKMFNSELENEFNNQFGEDSIYILNDEDQIEDILAKLNKDINNSIVKPKKYNILDNKIDEVIISDEIKSEIMNNLAERNIFQDEYVIEEISNIQKISVIPEELENNNWNYVIEVEISILTKNSVGDGKCKERIKKAELEITTNNDKIIDIVFRMGEINFQLRGGIIDEIV